MVEPKFLVVRLGSLGDIVHTFPAVSALRESFPSGEIVWLTHPKWEELVRAANLASEVWTVDPRDWAQLRRMLARVHRHQFDAAIDYQGLWKSASIPFLSGIEKRIGFSSATIREAGVPLLYTDKVAANAASHLAEQNGELSVRAGAKQATGKVCIRVSAEDEASMKKRLEKEGIGQYIVLSPGGGWSSKCWPASRYGQLSQRILRELGLRSVVNAGPGDEPAVKALLASAGDARPLPYQGDLGELMALLKNAATVVAGDTGPLHLADGLGAPVVAIFGPTDPARNGPYWRSGVVLRWEGAQTTYKRGVQADESLLHISVDEVMNALRGMREAA